MDALEMTEIGFKPAKLQEPAIPILEYRVKLNIAKAYIELEEYEVAKALLDEMINRTCTGYVHQRKSRLLPVAGSMVCETARL